MFDSLTTLFVAQPSVLFYMAVASFGVFAILLIPCVLAAPSADHNHTVAAIAMYVMQFLGLVFVFAGIAPMVLLLASGVLPSTDMLQLPIILLVIGIWMLVHYGHEVKKLDANARALPYALYAAVMHMGGIALFLVASLSAAVSIFVNYELGQWDGYLLLAIAGVLLTALFPLPLPRRKAGLLAKARRK